MSAEVQNGIGDSTAKAMKQNGHSETNGTASKLKRFLKIE